VKLLMKETKRKMQSMTKIGSEKDNMRKSKKTINSQSKKTI